MRRFVTVVLVFTLAIVITGYLEDKVDEDNDKISKEAQELLENEILYSDFEATNTIEDGKQKILVHFINESDKTINAFVDVRLFSPDDDVLETTFMSIQDLKPGARASEIVWVPTHGGSLRGVVRWVRVETE